MCHTVGKILMTKFAAKSSPTAAAELSAVVTEMDVWKDSVPTDMRYHGLDGDTQSAFWANMLQVAYKYVLFFYLIDYRRPSPPLTFPQLSSYPITSPYAYQQCRTSQFKV